MAFLTLRAAPAGRTPYGSVCQIVTFGPSSPVVTKRVEVKRAADCQAAFDAFRAEITAQQVADLATAYDKTAGPGDVPGASLYGIIFDRDGRKPSGYNALKLEAFVAAGVQS
jgi:hypothetical protein